MKELTTAEKAHAYDEAIKRAKAYLTPDTPDRVDTVGAISTIFPELAESKDEKVRKEIIELVMQPIWKTEKEFHRRNELCAWLKKQGQVKESTISQHENRTCEENGNSLTYKGEGIRKEIINYFQCQSEEEPTRKEIHNKWIAWLENIPYTIDHEKREGFHLGYREALDYAGGFCVLKKNEQRMVSAEESLGIDSGTYDKIVDECIFGEQKPEENKGNIGGISSNWSEEDSPYYDDICEILINFLHSEKANVNKEAIQKDLDWITSVKKRMEMKQEWSEEDEIRFQGCINDYKCYENHHLLTANYIENLKWIKSIKGRVKPQWKPSDEQIAQLQIVVDTYGNEGIYDPILTELLFQLKKLKEG